MHIVVTSVALVLGAGAALAQVSITPVPTAPPPSAAAPAKPKPGPAAVSPATPASKNAVAEAKAECMRMWDAGTHMSKREWSSTCDRIQTRLDNLKIENLDVMGTGVRKKGTGRQSRIDLPIRAN